MDKIDVIILCGGKGTRLKNVINDRPKSMAEIKGKPFLDILIDYISGYGFKRFILCTGYMGNFIKDYYRHKKCSQEIIFSEEYKPLGTAGAIKNTENLLQSKTVLVTNGDSFCQFNISDFLDFHLQKKALVSIAMVESANPEDFGSISLDNNHKITHFAEKKDNTKAFINAGVYLFQKEFLQLIPAGTNYSLEYQVFSKLIDKAFYGYLTGEKLIDIGTPERYREFKNKIF